MVILRFILGIWWFCLVGYSALSLIYSKREELFVIERWSLSFGLGVGILSFEMLLLSIVGIGFNPIMMIIPWIVLFLIIILRDRQIDFKKEFNAFISLSNMSRIEFVLLAGITFEIGLVFIEAIVQPIHGMDPMAMWSYKSKVFFFERAVPLDHIDWEVFRRPSYPLLTSLMETWIYLWIGETSDWLINVIRPLFFICILVVFYYSVRRFMSRRLSLCFLFILSSVPIFSHISAKRLADVPLSYFYFVAIIALFRWMENLSHKDALLAGLFLGFAMFTKQEGKALFTITFLLISSFCFLNREKGLRRRVIHMVLYGIIAIGITAPWDFYALYRGFGMGHDVLGFLSKLGELPQFISYWLYRMVTLYFWNIFWPCFLLISIFFLRHGLFNLKGRIIYLHSIIPIYFFLLILVFTSSFSHLHFDPRVLLPLVPLALFVISLLISNFIDQSPATNTRCINGVS